MRGALWPPEPWEPLVSPRRPMPSANSHQRPISRIPGRMGSPGRWNLGFRAIRAEFANRIRFYRDTESASVPELILMLKAAEQAHPELGH